jgi:predicted MPP superfamily phosphohydrolase
VLAGFLIVLLPHPHNSGPITSRPPDPPFDRHRLPDVFIHAADIHANHNIPSRQTNWSAVLSLVDENMKAPPLVVTGDLADDFPKAVPPRYGQQQPEDLPLYIEQLAAHPRIQYLDLAGNHDMFAINSFDSDENHLGRSKDVSNEQFRISVETWYLPKHNFTIILANPFEFPTPHPPLLYLVRASGAFLDALEDAVDGLPDDTINIFCAHFAFNLWVFDRRSKKGRTIHQILTSGSFHLYLSGHSHPTHPIVQHHGPLIEVVGVDLIEHFGFNVVTFDNGRFAYHSVNVFEPKLTFVTNPVPRTQVTTWAPFSDQDTPLRVIVYPSVTPTHIESPPQPPNIRVDGSVSGQLFCEWIPSCGYWLCWHPLGLGPGDHSVTFSEDYDGVLRFVIGDHVASFWEDGYEKFYVVPIYVVFALAWAFCVFIAILVNLPARFAVRYTRWVEKIPQEGSYWALSICCGFIGMKIRVSQLPWICRISLIVAVLWGPVGPLVFTTVEGKVGFVWLAGHWLAGSAPSVFVWGGLFGLIYMLVIVFPAMILPSGLSVFPHWANVIDLVAALLRLAIHLVFAITYGTESTGSVRMLCAPGLAIIPVYLWVLVCVLAVRRLVRRTPGKTNVFLLDQGSAFFTQ